MATLLVYLILPIMKKYFSPILYLMFFGLAFVSVFMLSVLIDSADILDNTTLLLSLTTLTLGSFVYWTGNRALLKFENTTHIQATDHFRHSALLYVIAILLFFTSIVDGIQGGLAEGVSLTLFGVCVWGIIVNASFLYHKKSTGKNV